MRLIYQARTKDDRQGIKNGTRKVITIPQRESLAKKYAAYAIEQYKDQGGSKKFGNKKSDILTIKCDIFFNNFMSSSIYKEMPLHDKGDLYLDEKDKEAIAKKAKSILTQKKYKAELWGTRDLKVHTIKK